MHEVIYHHYHNQNYCNVILNSTGRNMIANTKDSEFTSHRQTLDNPFNQATY